MPCLLEILDLLRVPNFQKRRSPERVREQLYGIWIEQERVRSGASRGPFALLGWDFRVREWSVWLRRGELSATGSKRGVRVDATAACRSARSTGMDGGVLKPGIFKFDGDGLVIAVVDRWYPEKPLATGADHPNRPTEFQSTKANGVAVYVLEPRRSTFTIRTEANTRGQSCVRVPVPSARRPRSSTTYRVIDRGDYNADAGDLSAGILKPRRGCSRGQ